MSLRTGESVTIWLTPVAGVERRLRIDPIVHDEATHRLVEEERREGRWHVTGSEELHGVDLLRSEKPGRQTTLLAAVEEGP